jgi:hypothetical protein
MVQIRLVLEFQLFQARCTYVIYGLLNLYPNGLVFKFWCIVYEKREYYLNRKQKNYERNVILWKLKQRLCSLS